MLAKVPVRRADSRSSFAALTKYVTKNAAAIFHSASVTGVETAAKDMESVARLRERVKDPVYHYVLSWRAGETLTNSQAFDSMVATLSALKMKDHQWIGAVHRNTEHVHAHIAVNRINPDTFKSVYPKGDWIVLDRTCRELELKHGWVHSRGPHRVEMATNGAPQIQRITRDALAEQRASATARARDFSAWTGLQNFQDWLGQKPAAELERVLGQPDVTWSDIHRSLATFNLEYRKTGSGAIVVDRERPDKFHAKASHVGRFASLPRLEARLGQFEARLDKTRTYDQTHARLDDARTRSYHSYAEGRAPRKEQRRSEREALHDRFIAAKDDWSRANRDKIGQAWAKQRNSEKLRLNQLCVENRETRTRICRSTTNGNKKILYSIQAFNMAAKREVLREIVKDERAELKAKLNYGRPPGWREWLGLQAAAGDEAAIRALRGIRYRERRERQRQPQQGIITSPELPKKTLLRALHWTADARGVNYIRANVTVFRDEGRRVIFSELTDDTVRAGLMLCHEKWAGELYIGGTTQFKSNVSILAAEMGIRVINLGSEVQSRVDEPTNKLVTTALNAPELPTVDVERAAWIYGKTAFTSSPRLGKQHSGKLVAVGLENGGNAFALLDAGPQLAVIYTTIGAANQLRERIGQNIRVRSTALDWKLVDLERLGPDLQHGR